MLCVPSLVTAPPLHQTRKANTGRIPRLLVPSSSMMEHDQASSKRLSPSMVSLWHCRPLTIVITDHHSSHCWKMVLALFQNKTKFSRIYSVNIYSIDIYSIDVYSIDIYSIIYYVEAPVLLVPIIIIHWYDVSYLIYGVAALHWSHPCIPSLVLRKVAMFKTL
jgi:hypothetical protein